MRIASRTFSTPHIMFVRYPSLVRARWKSPPVGSGSCRLPRHTKTCQGEFKHKKHFPRFALSFYWSLCNATEVCMLICLAPSLLGNNEYDKDAQQYDRYMPLGSSIKPGNFHTFLSGQGTDPRRFRHVSPADLKLSW